MEALDNLFPSEQSVTRAYAFLSEMHLPRSVAIGHTGQHACAVCDEVWPCDVATLLAGFREFRQEAKRLAEVTMHLSEITRATAEMVTGAQMPSLSREQQVSLVQTLTRAVQEMSRQRRA
jgi:hypothetical protein